MKAAQLRDLLGVDYTDEQLAAATAELGPRLIVAAAGTGKTTVMAARVVWLVATGQVAPAQVLGLTFTAKAAGELAARVRAALARWAEADPAGGPAGEEPLVCTYHAYANQLVREHGLLLGVEPDAALLADATRFQLAGRVVRAAQGPLPELPLNVPRVIRGVVSLDGELAEHLVDLDQLRRHDRDLLARLSAELAPPGPARATLRAALTRAREATEARLALAGMVEAFRAAKRGLGRLDFADLVALAARLAQDCPAVRAAERERFRVVLLDEYQDTSVAQRVLLARLFDGAHPVTAVGDPCQAIYGWRGAAVANIDAFPEHFSQADGRPAPVSTLSVNQRGGSVLLDLANGASERLRERHRTPLLRPAPAAHGRGRVSLALLDTQQEEADWVATRLAAELHAGGTLRPRDLAVLVRTRAEIPILHAALTGAGLPVEVVGLSGLLTVPPVAEVVAMLRLLADPTAGAAAVRLLAGPRWRVGPRDLALLGRRAAELAGPPAGAAGGGAGGDLDAALSAQVALGADPAELASLLDAVEDPGPGPYSPEARERFAAFAAELAELRRHAGAPVLDVIQRIVATTGLEVEVEASPEALRAGGASALEAFRRAAAEFTGLDGEATLASFTAYLDAAQEYDRGLAFGTPSGVDAVALLTVHAAKGLEWEVVALPTLVDDNFPVERLRDVWLNTHHVLPRPLRGDRVAGEVDIPPSWDRAGLDLFERAGRHRLATEEERLWYVALTRARSAVYASGHWWGSTQRRARGPSKFLTALHDRAGELGWEVASWAPQPVATTNPLLSASAATPWPAEVPDDLARRRERAAAAVLAHLGAPGLDGPAAGPSAGPAGGAPVPAEPAGLVEGWDRDIEALLAEASGDRGAVRCVEVPRALSVSELLALRRDPDAFARALVRPMPRRPVAAARRGTRFHAWVESLFAGCALLEPEDLPGAADTDLSDAELAELQAAFLATPWGQRRPHALEAPFLTLVGGHVLRGRIDAVYPEPGGWHVVDWKTGQEPADPVQLAVYRLAWARRVGCPPDRVRASFLWLRTGVLETPEPLPGEAELASLLAAGPGGTRSPLAPGQGRSGRNS